MATIVDSYSESNQTTSEGTYTARTALGQSFTGDGGVLDIAKFYLSKSNSPTGNAVAKIYAHSGTFGTSSVPTGSVLATSGNFDVSTLTTSLQLITFTFSGANKITLTNGTYYILVIEFFGDGTNFISWGCDSTSPSHGGNISRYTSGSWAADSSRDFCFYVFKDDTASASPSLSPSSSVSPSLSISPSPSLSISLSPSPSPGAGPFFGLKIAKPGVNALTNSDIDKYIFHSEYGTLKYFTKQSINISFNAAAPDSDISARGSYDHNLNYYPYAEVYVRTYTGATPTGNYEYCPFYGAGASIFYSANYILTKTKIYVYGQINGVSSSTWHFDFIVFLFKNNLNL